MRLSRDEVEHVAELAKLGLSEEELEQYRSQLSDILDHIEVLNELDTTNVQPMAHVTGVENVTREDVVIPSLPSNAVLANAPDQEDGHFKVPAVLED